VPLPRSEGASLRPIPPRGDAIPGKGGFNTGINRVTLHVNGAADGEAPKRLRERLQLVALQFQVTIDGEVANIRRKLIGSLHHRTEYIDF